MVDNIKMKVKQGSRPVWVAPPFVLLSENIEHPAKESQNSRPGKPHP